mmetsp:Transcript_21098/g.44325  ORF Transcript_21098/g.44325 Transcript_21098/m.44325 type:complete len:351 (-) Transcript_21098:946-1998(-)
MHTGCSHPRMGRHLHRVQQLHAVPAFHRFHPDGKQAIQKVLLGKPSRGHRGHDRCRCRRRQEEGRGGNERRNQRLRNQRLRKHRQWRRQQQQRQREGGGQRRENGRRNWIAVADGPEVSRRRRKRTDRGRQTGELWLRNPRSRVVPSVSDPLAGLFARGRPAPRRRHELCLAAGTRLDLHRRRVVGCSVDLPGHRTRTHGLLLSLPLSFYGSLSDHSDDRNLFQEPRHYPLGRRGRRQRHGSLRHAGHRGMFLRTVARRRHQREANHWRGRFHSETQEERHPFHRGRCQSSQALCLARRDDRFGLYEPRSFQLDVGVRHPVKGLQPFGALVAWESFDRVGTRTVYSVRLS